MPFTTTNIAPSTTPMVTVAFSGLIVLRPGANDTCEMGVHKFSRDHRFQVLLVVEKLAQPNATPPPPTIPVPLPPVVVPLLVGPLFAPFTISLDPDPTPGAGDFKIFARDPFNRVVPPSHPLDYRWVINFKDLHFNAQTNDGVQPVGTLKTGVLYTPHLTDPDLEPRLVRQGQPDFPLFQIASSLAASIEVPTPAQTKVKFQWQDLGDPVDLVLPRDGDDPDTTRYTIYFINEPPSINYDEHEEFSRFYQVLQAGGAPIPANQRFELRFDDGTRTDEIPCAPVLLNP